MSGYMHHMCLYGEIPPDNLLHIKQVFAGVVGNQPYHKIERRITYRPTKEPEAPGSHLKRGGTQSVINKTKQKTQKQTGAKALYREQLIQEDLHTEDFTLGTAPATSNTLAGSEKRPWIKSWKDVPDAINPENNAEGLCLRLTHTTPITKGDAHAYMLENDFK